MPPTLEHGRLLSHVPKVINIANGDNGRLYIKLCHFSRPRPELGATLNTALGRTAGKMAELLMNSAIPSEGSMRTSWPRLRNSYLCEPGVAVHFCQNPSRPASMCRCAKDAVGPFRPRGIECHPGLAEKLSLPPARRTW